MQVETKTWAKKLPRFDTPHSQWDIDWEPEVPVMSCSDGRKFTASTATTRSIYFVRDIGKGTNERIAIHEGDSGELHMLEEQNVKPYCFDIWANPHFLYYDARMVGRSSVHNDRLIFVFRD